LEFLKGGISGALFKEAFFRAAFTAAGLRLATILVFAMREDDTTPQEDDTTTTRHNNGAARRGAATIAIAREEKNGERMGQTRRQGCSPQSSQQSSLSVQAMT
jgi:hypothetical protein